MSRASFPVIAAILASFAGASYAAEGASNPNNCKVIERQKSVSDSSTLSTSVQAGNGQVSAQSSGGNGVTVHSGNGGTTSSVASTTGSGGRTVVTASDGSCTIYVNPEQKKE